MSECSLNTGHSRFRSRTSAPILPSCWTPAGTSCSVAAGSSQLLRTPTSLMNPCGRTRERRHPASALWRSQRGSVLRCLLCLRRERSGSCRTLLCASGCWSAQRSEDRSRRSTRQSKTKWRVLPYYVEAAAWNILSVVSQEVGTRNFLVDFVLYIGCGWNPSVLETLGLWNLHVQDALKIVLIIELRVAVLSKHIEELLLHIQEVLFLHFFVVKFLLELSLVRRWHRPV